MTDQVTVRMSRSGLTIGDQRRVTGDEVTVDPEVADYLVPFHASLVMTCERPPVGEPAVVATPRRAPAARARRRAKART